MKRLATLARTLLGAAVTSLTACAATPAPLPPPDPSDPHPILASPAEQARMQAYADSLYDRRYVRASFQDPGGNWFDCIDVDRQPSCRNGGCPGIRTTGGAGGGCASGTIPIMRPRVELMRHFRTLEEWQHGPHKGPPPGGPAFQAKP